MKHRITDPACVKYRARRKWRNNRGRGKGCRVCVPPIRVAIPLTPETLARVALLPPAKREAATYQLAMYGGLLRDPDTKP